ncbi:MAG: molybdenum cofactor guanylyltransferase [Planctomycetota bacterium]
MITEARPLLGIVLCGGRSTRMGCDKAALLHPSGVSFLDHAHDRLLKVCSDVFVSGRTYQHRYRTIEDPVADRGPATGVAASLSHAAEEGYAGCLVTPVDTPMLTATHLELIAERAQGQPDRVVCAIDIAQNRRQPLIAAYPIRLRESIQSLADSDKPSLRQWLDQQDPVVIPVDSDSLLNVNSPEDLAVALKT